MTEPGPGPYGNALTCPNCDGFEFFMYRNCIHHGDNPTEIADCIQCNATTYAFVLKDKYHEDKGEDFDILGVEKQSITLECQECGREYNDGKLYQETAYRIQHILISIPNHQLGIVLITQTQR